MDPSTIQNANRVLHTLALESCFPSIDEKDGDDPLMGLGNLALPEGYIQYLDTLLALQEADQPLPHLQKHRLVVGDASQKITEYLTESPETIIALAYFDFDIYKPTKECLEKIKQHLTIGSVVGFDELGDPSCLGETTALNEVFGLNNIRLHRVPWCTKPSWFVVDEHLVSSWKK